MAFNCYGFGIECGVALLLFGCCYDFLLSVSELFRLVSVTVHVFEYFGIVKDLRTFFVLVRACRQCFRLSICVFRNSRLRWRLVYGFLGPW